MKRMQRNTERKPGAGRGTWRAMLAAVLGATLTAGGAVAQDLPGEGVKVRPLMSNIVEELFQAMLVKRGLEELGYDVQPITETQIQLAHVTVGQGDADYYTPHWWPLHKGFWEESGGDARLRKLEAFVDGPSLQGYLVDKKTADAHGIDNLGQLKDPEVARLFDIDGDGKADLYGCEPGWGCERVIEHHLTAYGLRDTVTHNQGGYFAIIPDAIERIKAGQSTLYYTWTPFWVSGILRPGDNVSWLEVPYTDHPSGLGEADTTVEGIGNVGFAVNTQHVIAGTPFLDANPAARRWFELLKMPVADVNAQNLKMRDGEKTEADVARHADEWIAAHREQWDAWIAEAKQAR